MSLKSIGLKKALQLCGADQPFLVSEIRKDIRQDIKKLQSQKNGGGDFHIPFWSDAKRHVFLGNDLRTATKARIQTDEGRKRLYKQLRDGFLNWWNTERLTTNEKIGELEANIHARYQIPKLDVTLKVDNLMCMRVGNNVSKAVYPYFPETPALQPRWARIGLWLMKQSLEDFALSEMKILDVLRAKEFSEATHPLKGNEQEIFEERYSAILQQWDDLKSDYPDYEERFK